MFVLEIKTKILNKNVFSTVNAQVQYHVSKSVH